jgi:hemerythrin-like domain-containing protein
MASDSGVCAVLVAEHSVIRQALGTLEALLQAGLWREPGAGLQRVRGLMDFIEAFDRHCHRPKEYDHLLPALSGRSGTLDRLMDSLDQAHTRGDDRLDQAFALLAELERGDAARAEDFALALRRHQATVLRRLQAEEGVLLPMARELLGRDDWAEIAAAMPVVRPARWQAGAAPARTPRAAGHPGSGGGR